MATPNNQIRRRGSFAPLSAHYYLDDALAKAGEEAELLYVRGLAFCAATLSDGFISTEQLTRGPGVALRNLKRRTERLIEVGLWERVEGGFRVRSWLGWNKSRDEVMAAMETDRERKSRGGKGRPPTPPPDGDTAKPHPHRNGHRTDSERNPAGHRTDSGSNSTYTYTYTDTDTAAAAAIARPDRARDSGGGGAAALVDTWTEDHPGVTETRRRDLTDTVTALLANGADPALIPAALDDAHGARWRNPVKALPHAYEDVRRARYPGPALAATGTSTERVNAILAHRTGNPR